MDGSRKQSADGMLRRQRPPATRLQSSLRLTQALKKPRWREDGNALIRAQLQQIAIATDDHIGLSGDGQRPEPVVIRIARSAGRCSSVFMPQRQLHQRSVPDVAVDDQPFSFHPRAAGPARPRSYLGLRRVLPRDATRDAVVRAPVPLKILQERRSVGQQPMHLEAAQRKGEPMIDGDVAVESGDRHPRSTQDTSASRLS